MASTSSSLPQVSRKTPVPIVLAGSIVTLGPHWRSCISSYIDPLVKRISEENYSHPLGPMNLVAYSQVHPALIDLVHSVVGHDEDGSIVTDRVIMEDSPDLAAYCGYMSVIETTRRHPNEEFSFFLWHVAAGQHGSWDLKWEIVCGELMKRDVNLSVVLLDDCPIFEQLFSAISPTRSGVTPWFHTFPDHRFLLSSFTPPVELGGAVPSVVSAGHAAPSFPVPSTIGVTAWNPPSEFPAHGTRYPDDQRAAPPSSQHPGPDVYAQGPAIAPFLNLDRRPQASSSAVVQSQPYLNLDNMSVPEAQGLAPIGCQCPAPPHSSRVEQRQPAPYDYTEKIDSRDNLPNANARPMSSGSSDEMSDNEWTGMLNLNGTRVPVRALVAEAIGDPKLSALPNELEVELAVGLKLSILAIQEWIRKNKAPMVRLSYVDGTDNSDFDQLVEKIRAHGYAIVTWEKRDRLLLAPLGKVLLCAAFPEKGALKRPTSQPLRKVRTLTRKYNLQKKENSQKMKKQKSRQKPMPYPTTTSKSYNGPCDGVSPSAAAPNTITLQWPQSELSQLSATVSSTAACSFPGPAPRGMLNTHGDQRVHQHMDTGTAGCMADPPNLNLDAMDVSDMYEFLDFDGFGDKDDNAS